MAFLRFKKDEAIALRAQTIDLRLPFREIKVLQENLGLIKRHVGLEDVQILSAVDASDLAKAGPLISLFNKGPPSSRSPTTIFITN